MATAGEGTPPTIESSENRAGADVAAGGGLPAEGQDMGATVGAGGMNKAEGAQEVGAGAPQGGGGAAADMETSRLSRNPGDVSERQEMIRSIRERRMAEEEKIDADRRELAKLIERGTEFLSPGQIRRIVQCLEGPARSHCPCCKGWTERSGSSSETIRRLSRRQLGKQPRKQSAP